MKTYVRTRGSLALEAWLDAHDDVTKTQLAKQIPVHPSEVSHWLVGRRVPSRAFMFRVQDLTGIEPRQWLQVPRARKR